MGFNPGNYRPDGFQVLNRGVHSGLAPNTLPTGQLAWAVNVTTRFGFPATRPGWRKRSISFEDSTDQTNFETKLWQGGLAFEASDQLIASIGGRIFSISTSTYNVADITPGAGAGSATDNPNRADLRRAWLVEANGFVVIQDGQDKPIIYDGAGARRSDPYAGDEVPTGTVMNFNSGRLWVASPDRKSFVAGDIAYGPSGTTRYNRADAVLKFTENDFLNEGGSFTIPINSGKIQAMASLAQLDASDGQGPLQVFTDRAVFSVNAPFSREQWKNLQYPIQTVGLVDSGATGWTTPITVNGDIWYRAGDGIRSFRAGRQEFQSGWQNTPQSRELTRILDRDDETALRFASSGLHRNRLLMTVAPKRDWDHGTYHRGLAVLDFAPIGSIGSAANPVWDGVWSGLNILQLVSGIFEGQERTFAFVLSSSDKIELWELGDEPFDYNADGVKSRIACRIETASYNWESGFDMRRLELGEVWYDQIEDRVEFDIDWRPDQEPCWQDWHTWESCAKIENCLTADSDTGCAGVPENLQPQYRQRVMFPVPQDDVDSINNKPYRHGYEFQFKLSWTGAVRIKKMRLWSSPVAEELAETITSDH